MVSRRDFLKTSSVLCGSLGMVDPAPVFAAASKPSGYFGVHPFVEQHPEAVFILRTHVDYKTNSDACKRVGLDFGRSVFVPMDNTGTPVTYNIAAKPNLTAHQAVDEKRGFTLEDTMGIATDVFFVEGLFESLKELGVAGTRMHTRDANGSRRDRTPRIRRHGPAGGRDGCPGEEPHRDHGKMRTMPRRLSGKRFPAAWCTRRSLTCGRSMRRIPGT